jgi:8-oxo-dGTP pyrophosphatase MutT (NUDIX family)
MLHGTRFVRAGLPAAARRAIFTRMRRRGAAAGCGKRCDNRPRMQTLATLDRLRESLARRAAAARGGAAASAAVAAVLRDGSGGLDLLFIRRAEHRGDPWSGHMAWPGGHVDEDDASPLAAAIREAREELTLDLERDGEHLGALPPVRTHLRKGPGPRLVAPFVFALRGDPALEPNHEVQEAMWVPLSFLVERRNRGRFVWMGRVLPVVLPCYRFQGRVIWGLTLRMIDDLLAHLAPGPSQAR